MKNFIDITQELRYEDVNCRILTMESKVSKTTHVSYLSNNMEPITRPPFIHVACFRTECQRLVNWYSYFFFA